MKTYTPTFVTCMSSIEVEESLLKQCSGLGEEKEKGRGGGEKRRGKEERREGREKGERGEREKEGKEGDVHIYMLCCRGYCSHMTT